MSIKQTRHSISISGDLYRTLKKAVTKQGTTMSNLIERTMRQLLKMPAREPVQAAPEPKRVPIKRTRHPIKLEPNKAGPSAKVPALVLESEPEPVQATPVQALFARPGFIGTPGTPANSLPSRLTGNVSYF